MNYAKYGSRKFIVTMTGLIGGILLAAFGKVDANIALIIGGCVAAYDYFNTKESANVD